MSRHRSFRLTPDESADASTAAPSLRSAISLAVVQQAILLMLSGLILDGGMIMRLVLVPTIAFWCFVLLLLIRRASKATAGDIVFIKLSSSQFGLEQSVAVSR